jgi:hypothetical protein
LNLKRINDSSALNSRKSLVDDKAEIDDTPMQFQNIDDKLCSSSIDVYPNTNETDKNASSNLIAQNNEVY